MASNNSIILNSTTSTNTESAIMPLFDGVDATDLFFFDASAASAASVSAPSVPSQDSSFFSLTLTPTGFSPLFPTHGSKRPIFDFSMEKMAFPDIMAATQQPLAATVAYQTEVVSLPEQSFEQSNEDLEMEDAEDNENQGEEEEGEEEQEQYTQRKSRATKRSRDDQDEDYSPSTSARRSGRAKKPSEKLSQTQQLAPAPQQKRAKGAPKAKTAIVKKEPEESDFESSVGTSEDYIQMPSHVYSHQEHLQQLLEEGKPLSKKALNKLAADKYRRKKRMQFQELTVQAEGMARENRELKLRCEKLESEVKNLKDLLLNTVKTPKEIQQQATPASPVPQDLSLSSSSSSSSPSVPSSTEDRLSRMEDAIFAIARALNVNSA